MANLFFVHTPFQLFVAQQLIHYKKLVDNIMIYGYIGRNSHSLDLYDIMIMDEFWKARIYLENINDWNIFQIKHPINSYLRTFKTKKWFEDILDKYNITDVFFGDMNNTCYQLMMLYYQKDSRFKINVYEEGNSHYVNSTQASLFGPLSERLFKCICNNALYYMPVWRIPFASYLYLRHIEYEKLKIYKRYSLCPYYHESFDEQLIPSVIMSEKVREIINDEISNVNTENAFLFLSEPMGEVSSLEWKLELLTLERELKTIDSNSTVIIKFHPRETIEKKKDILSVFDRYNQPYKVICEKVNIPIEYFLQIVNFKKILTYFCSTVFYNGYLFKRTQLYSFMPTYYDLCKEYRSEFTDEIDMYLNSEYYKKLFGDEYGQV